MNSYFTNPPLSCHLNGGQEVLSNVTLSSTNYDPVRHFSPYGAAVAQNRIYANPFYSPQENVMFGPSRGPYEYGSNVFYQDKDVLPSCRQSLGQTQGSLTQDYASDPGKTASQEPKGNIQIYPWMQRMNSHSGEYGHKRDIFSSYRTDLFVFTTGKPKFYDAIKHSRNCLLPCDKRVWSSEKIQHAIL